MKYIPYPDPYYSHRETASPVARTMGAYQSCTENTSRILLPLLFFSPFLLQPSMKLSPVLLYAPNILCYTRIVLALLGLSYASQGDDSPPSSSSSALAACLCWVAAAVLDLFDGVLARAWHQTSSVGVLLDILADNILRTTMWMAATTDGDSNNNGLRRIMAALCISLEWTTLVCTQLLQQEEANEKKKHWKEIEESASASPPWWIRTIFANNFRNPLGAWCIGGLFGTPFFAYLDNSSHIRQRIPLFEVWKYMAYGGRAVSVVAELWFCRAYLATVVAADEKERQIGMEKSKRRQY